MSLKLALILATAFIGCISGAPNRGNKIVGGNLLNITQAPWQVSIQNQGGLNHYCGGTIISDRWILTTWGCIGVGTVNTGFIRVGVTHKYEDGQLYRVEKTITHENYDPITNDYNYGLIKLKIKLEFNDKVKSIRMPNVDDEPVAAGTLCLVSGWGDTLNDSESNVILRGAKLPIIDQETCRRRGATPRMICAGFKEGGVDACRGDTGGPLVAFNSETKEPVLVGIVAASSSQCAMPGSPQVFSSVLAEREWIHSNSGV